MTERLFYVGSHGPYYVDDADTIGSEGGTLEDVPYGGLVTEGDIYATEGVIAYGRDSFRYAFMMAAGS